MTMIHCKKVILSLLASFLFSLAFTQSLTVVKLKNNAVFAEFTPKAGFFDTSPPLKSSYYLGPQTNASLQAALKKAIEWAKLNEKHKKQFKKEIIRLKFVEKGEYESLSNSEVFTYNHMRKDEAKLIFSGYESGEFLVELNVSGTFRMSFFFENIKMLEDTISLLQGKSVNKEIDDIFN